MQRACYKGISRVAVLVRSWGTLLPVQLGLGPGRLSPRPQGHTCQGACFRCGCWATFSNCKSRGEQWALNNFFLFMF